MKAAVLNGETGKFDVEEIDIDQPQGREILVEIRASGLCHTDLHMARGGFGVALPAVLGHELAGVVRETGPDVTEFAVGDHVVGSLLRYCGKCKACRQGRTYQCPFPEATQREAGLPSRLSRRGDPVTAVFGTAGFAEYALVHENQLVKVPDELPFPQAAVLGCSCVTGIGAVVNSAALSAGDAVAVIGIGGVGLNVIAGARLAGARRIIAIDVQPAKEELARKFGATDFVLAQEGGSAGAVRCLVDGGVDHAFDAVGLAEATRDAIAMVRKGGAVHLIGLHRPGSKLELDVNSQLILSQVTLRGVYMGASDIKIDIPAYAELYLQGRLNLDDLISREIRLDQINEAYDELERNPLARSVITAF